MPGRVINKLIKSYFILNANLQTSSFLNQENILFDLVSKCQDTVFGKRYWFKNIQTIRDFQNQVPISHYHDLEPRIHYMLKWERDITYPGKIDRFATSSWTTWNESKYIPVTKEGLKRCHFKWWADVLRFFCKNNPRSQFLKWKWLVIGWTFSQNPYTWEDNVGFISAILQKNTPRVGKILKEPWDDIAYIENREEKLLAIVKNTINQNITFINWSPGRILNLLYKILEYTGKKNIMEVRPNLELFFWWWLPITLYKSQFEEMIPNPKMKYYQIYNASEWFFWVQDQNWVDDMLLLTNHGSFYEFIPTEEYGKEDPTVLTLEEVSIWEEYVMLISTFSWVRRYVIWDIVTFTNLDPWKIKITWRTKYFIDIIWERLLLKHIEKAMMETTKKTDTIISEFTVWPHIFHESKWSRWAHEWIIEFTKKPKDLKNFAQILDREIGNLSAYYFDERHDTKTLWEPIIHAVEQWTFYDRMKSKNKLWWQFKVPKVKNDREILDDILNFIK